MTRASTPRLWKGSWWASVRPLAAALWRGVEAQHFVSTMKLVDSLAEQEELEGILEASKPALPGAPGQHYLLSTPFRYPSPHPSDYAACTVLAAEARRRDVQWIRYWSARDVAGHCGAVFDPDSLKAVGLNKQQTWVRKVSAGAALMRHERDSISLAFTFS